MIVGAFFFALTIITIPGWSGSGTTPRWALACVVLPVLIYFISRGSVAAERTNHSSNRNGPRVESWELRPSPREFTTAHALGLLFIWCAAISVSWSNHYDGLDALLKLIVIAEAFWLGSKLEDLKPVIIGSGLGIWVSSLVMLTGFEVPHMTDHAGLFVNSNTMGETAALVLVAAVFYRGSGHGSIRSIIDDSWWCRCWWVGRCHRWLVPSRVVSAVPPLYWLVPGILPAFILSHCRGAFVAVLGCFTLWLWGKSRIAALSLCLIGIGAVYLMGAPENVTIRLTMWTDVLPRLTFMGHGLGSFYTLFPLYSTGMDTLAIRPEHLHNDWLEFAFETGLVGAVSIVLFAWTISTNNMARLLLAALAIEACFGFPLHMAATAVLGGLIAGHATRNRHSLRYDFHAWRISLRALQTRTRNNVGHLRAKRGRKDIPAELHIQEGISNYAGDISPRTA